MTLLEVDAAIDRCRKHLNDTGTFGTEIEAYLTRYILIIIYSSFEQKIRETLLDNVFRSVGPPLDNYIMSCFKQHFRTITTGELAKFLTRIGSEYKERFRQKIPENSATEIAFNNIVINRDSTSHAEPSNMTFIELEGAYVKAREVLDAVLYAVSF